MDLTNLLSTHEHRRIYTGLSGSEVFYIPVLSAYLKSVAIDGIADLRREKDVLEWLTGKTHAPKVLGYEEQDGKQMMLISKMDGRPAHEYVEEHQFDPKVIEFHVEQAAKAMRGLHDIATTECPFPQDITTKLAKARENIAHGFVDEDDFDEENLDRSAFDIYDELVSTKPGAEELVFTHGDFCLPNYMVDENGEVTGFIDLERAGVGDRYQDIALFLRSFSHNAGTAMDVRETFCEAYGIGSLDEGRLRYYRLLDELF